MDRIRSTFRYHERAIVWYSMDVVPACVLGYPCAGASPLYGQAPPRQTVRTARVVTGLAVRL